MAHDAPLKAKVAHTAPHKGLRWRITRHTKQRGFLDPLGYTADLLVSAMPQLIIRTTDQAHKAANILKFNKTN